MKFKPLRDRVFVKFSRGRKNSGRSFIPDTAKEKPQRGTVIASGPGRLHSMMVNVSLWMLR